MGQFSLDKYYANFTMNVYVIIDSSADIFLDHALFTAQL